ncbi:MAG: pyridoxal phosphate-dependent decarboxylase family protein [Bacteroidales bacterium]
MLNNKEFRKYAHEFVDWMADFMENIEDYPVKSRVAPGDIIRQLPENAPEKGESMDSIFKDFKDIILPGMTHWQSPNFFAYFTANSSYPSVLAEMLTATLGAQCMIWETSPAAAELEERVMEWLKKMIGLPDFFTGVIQDTASTSTLVALLSAREKFSDFNINKRGFKNYLHFRLYCSAETHSSIEKGVKIAGFGKENLVKVGVDKQMRLDPYKLENAIIEDLSHGMIPLCVIATLGTTGTLTIDPLDKIANICRKYKTWLHVDAAFAGTALLLPEYRQMIKGIEQADSFVFNPHKWMFTNFDCSAYFVKDKETLIRTFEIMPEYLKTKADSLVNNYRDWGIQLGRRFRALKLWFVIRNYGVQGLQSKIRDHIDWAKKLAREIEKHVDFELMIPVTLNVLCFRYNDGKLGSEVLNRFNEKLMHRVNQTGRAYFTHTKINGQYTIRMVIGQTHMEKENVLKAWKLIQDTVDELKME